MASSPPHLKDDQLEDLLEERLPPKGQAEGLIHLSACTTCHGRLRTLYPEVAPLRFRKWFGTSKPPETPRMSRLDFEVAARWGSESLRAAVRDVEEGQELWSEVAEREPRERRLTVLEAPRFQSRGLSTTLLVVAKRTWRDAPVQALELTDLAASILDRLQPGDSQDGRRLHDLRALAFAYRANCHRILGKIDAAEEDFQRAHVHLPRGTGGPLERATVSDIQASYHRDLRRLKPARESIRVARRSYEEIADPEGLVRVAIQEALTLGKAGRPMQAIGILGDVAATCGRKRIGADNQWALHHNLAVLFTQSGQTSDAWSALAASRTWNRKLGSNRFDLARIEWLEAWLHADSGDRDLAEANFRSVQRFFLDEGIGVEAAIVSLDLATFYLTRGRYGEARSLAAEILPVLLAKGVHREALASWLLFWKASGR